MLNEISAPAAAESSRVGKSNTTRVFGLAPFVLAPVVAMVSSAVQAQVQCTGNCVADDGVAIEVGAFGGGDGTLTVEGGATVSTPNDALLGFQGSDQATVLVTGPGSRLDQAGGGGNVFVGGNGATGTLSIEDGGAVSTTGLDDGTQTLFSIGSGFDAGGSGTVNVNSGSSLLVQSLNGDAELLIGRVLNPSGGDSQGVLNIDGVGSSVTVDAANFAYVFVSNSRGPATGAAGLNITNGANLTISSASDFAGLYIAGGEFAQGTVRIDGAGSALSISGPSAVMTLGGNPAGVDGVFDERLPGVLEITDGGLLETTSADASLVVGNGLGDGRLIVNTGGALRTGGEVIVGHDLGPDSTQTGTLIVNDTGLVEAASIAIGYLPPEFLDQAGSEGSRGAFLIGTGTLRASANVTLDQRGLISPGIGFGAVGTLNIDGNFVS